MMPDKEIAPVSGTLTVQKTTIVPAQTLVVFVQVGPSTTGKGTNENGASAVRHQSYIFSSTRKRVGNSKQSNHLQRSWTGCACFESNVEHDPVLLRRRNNARWGGNGTEKTQINRRILMQPHPKKSNYRSNRFTRLHPHPRRKTTREISTSNEKPAPQIRTLFPLQDIRAVAQYSTIRTSNRQEGHQTYSIYTLSSLQDRERSYTCPSERNAGKRVYHTVFQPLVGTSRDGTKKRRESTVLYRL